MVTNESIATTVYPGTAQNVARLLERSRIQTPLDIGVPVTDGRRPFMSSRTPNEDEKVRTAVQLRTARDSSGALCVLYSISPKDGKMFQLPVGIGGITNPYETACTTEGITDSAYEYFEGVVRTSDGALIARAIKTDGTSDDISLSHNRIGKSFIEMVFIVAASKLEARM